MEQLLETASERRVLGKMVNRNSYYKEQLLQRKMYVVRAIS